MAGDKKKLPTITVYVPKLQGENEGDDFVKNACELEGHLQFTEDFMDARTGKRSKYINDLIIEDLKRKGYINADGTPNRDFFEQQQEAFKEKLRTPPQRKIS